MPALFQFSPDPFDEQGAISEYVEEYLSLAAVRKRPILLDYRLETLGNLSNGKKQFSGKHFNIESLYFCDYPDNWP